MPELPEVETIARELEPRVKGRRIRNVEVFSRQVLRHCLEQPSDMLRDRRIQAVERRGKFIVFALDRGWLVIHLGMTGQILFDTERTPWTRAIFTLDDTVMMYDDPRMFGTIEWGETLTPRVGRLGPEPFDITPSEFYLSIHKRRAPVKAVLLDQTVVRGMGNIYTDEALFRAKIHPRTRAMRVSRARAQRLHQEMLNVLSEAIEHRGSSVSDYRDTEGRKGEFQAFHRVYGREGEPCGECGTSIRRIVVGGRGTHYCPRCQR